MNHYLPAAVWLPSLILISCVLEFSSESLPANPSDPEPASLSVHAISFNIRNGLALDGDNSWIYRRDAVIDLIESRDPDFTGLQEAWLFQLGELEEGLPDYASIARTREVDENLGEAAPILYHAGRWRLDDSHFGTFWLSETPEVPGSVHFGNTLPRIATWARFIHQSSGRGIYVFNTHLDHASKNAREKGAQLIMERIHQRLNEDPVILLGDFNANETSTTLATFLDGPPQMLDTYRVLHPDTIESGTFNGFNGNQNGAKIDYVLVEGQAVVKEASIIRDNNEGFYPSDHFPVEATLFYEK